MKNSQKGFVIPLLISISVLALLGIGGWTYITTQKIQSESKVNVFQENSTTTKKSTENESATENFKADSSQETPNIWKETVKINTTEKTLTKNDIFRGSCKDWKGYFGTKDICLLELSGTYSKNSNDCKDIIDISVRDYCIMSVAQATNNPSLCLDITEFDKSGCYFDIARFNKDTKACLLISDKTASQNCVNQIQALSSQ